MQVTLHATHLRKWLDKMYEYEMDPTRTVGATERTRGAGWMDELMDGRTEWNLYTPQQLCCARGKKWMRRIRQNGQTPNCIDKKYQIIGHDGIWWSCVISVGIQMDTDQQTSSAFIWNTNCYKRPTAKLAMVYLIVYLSFFSLIDYSSKTVHMFISKYILLEVHYVSRIIHIILGLLYFHSI